MDILYGNFLGKEDGWSKDISKTFVNKEEILEKFKDFKIIYSSEVKYNRDSLKVKNKYWHVINIIAKKI